MTGVITAAACSARARRGFAALALASLFLTTLFTIADGQTAAWDPVHGHVYRDGIAAPHTHPWNTSSEAAARACVAPAPAPGDPADVVFTPSAEALAGATVVLPLLADGGASACAPALPLVAARITTLASPTPVFTAVITPPPRA